MKPQAKGIFGLIIVIALVGLSLIDGSSMTGASQWLPFLGRFHPVVLHLPIGLFAGAVLLELIGFVRPMSRKRENVQILLNFSFITAVFASLFGIFLSWEGGYEAEAVNFHKWAGVIATGIFYLLSYLNRRIQITEAVFSPSYAVVMLAAVVAITIAGHEGGSLTHGSDYLTKYFPFGQEEEEVLVADLATTPVFESHILPVLQDYCVQCHGPEKIKGDLRLDSFAGIMAGGAGGPAIEPGDSEMSFLIETLHFPIDDEEHMPPEGKPQPNDEIIALLEWWVDQGASETATIDELTITAAVASHFEEREVLVVRAREEIEPILQTLSENPNFQINFIANDEPTLDVRARNADEEDLQSLLAIKENIIRLDLAGAPITNEALDIVGQMTNLTRLHLENTDIDNSNTGSLSSLYQLEYLNLYNTGISDDTLIHLKKLKNLRNLYLWQTDVSEEAVANLFEAINPEIEIAKLREKVNEIERDMDRLKVEIVTDIEEPVEMVEVVERVFDPSVTTISSIMEEIHKGDDSIANRTKRGEGTQEDFEILLERYEELLKLTPPRGGEANWHDSVTPLITASKALIAGEEGAVDQYAEAVSCKMCHDRHK